MARRTKRIIAFRKDVIDALVPPTKDRVEWWDEKTPGLAIRVSSTGNKTFVWVGRHGRKFKRVPIGPYPATSIIYARDQAKILTAKQITGDEPTTKARTLRQEWNLKQLHEWYMESISKPHKRTWQWDQRQFERVLSPWANRRVSSINRSEVQLLHLELGKTRGPYAANKMLELLGHMIRQGKLLQPDRIPCDDPTKGIRRFPRVERERFLDENELDRFFTAVESLQREVSRDVLLMCLFTGGRRGNVMAMRWDEISISACVWTIPVEKSKSKRVMYVPLSDQAMRILKRRRRESTSQWVFPGQGPTGHYNVPKGAWSQIKKLAKLSDVRIHDLRRTLGSWMAVDHPLQIVGKQLGHSSMKSTAIYARLANKTVQKALNKATRKMKKEG